MEVAVNLPVGSKLAGQLGRRRYSVHLGRRILNIYYLMCSGLMCLVGRRIDAIRMQERVTNLRERVSVRSNRKQSRVDTVTRNAQSLSRCTEFLGLVRVSTTVTVERYGRVPGRTVGGMCRACK